jgi:hypothetical protein
MLETSNLGTNWKRFASKINFSGLKRNALLSIKKILKHIKTFLFGFKDFGLHGNVPLLIKKRSWNTSNCFGFDLQFLD